MKTLTVRNFAAIKRTAQNVNPLVVKKNKLKEKVEKLQEEIQDLETEIEGYEGGVVALTDGYMSEDLVTKVVEDSGKVDKEGNPIKVTKYVPTSLVTYDEENKVYIINEPKVSEEPVEEDRERTVEEETVKEIDNYNFD